MRFHNSVEQSGQFLSSGAGRAAVTYEMEMLRPWASLKVGVQGCYALADVERCGAVDSASDAGSAAAAAALVRDTQMEAVLN